MHWHAGTPADEFEFVVGGIGTRPGGLLSGGVPAPDRIGVTVDELLASAAERMSARGLPIEPRDFVQIRLLRAEVIALRLYTGPMYCLYNAVLRNKGQGPSRGKFTTTSAPTRAPRLPTASARVRARARPLVHVRIGWGLGRLQFT
jgi:hypothetical protein